MVKMRKVNGFTLMELMIVIAIIAIAAGMTVGLGDVVKKGRLTSQINTMISSINLARSEAIKRNRTVTICSSVTGAICSASLNWQTGWIIFVDLDGDGTLNGAEGPPIRVSPPLDGGANITFVYDRTALPFGSNGRIRAPTGGGVLPVGTFVLSDSTLTQVKNLVVSNSGRARVEY